MNKEIITGLTRLAYVVKCSYMATSIQAQASSRFLKAVPFVTQELARRPLEEEKVSLNHESRCVQKPLGAPDTTFSSTST